MKKVINLVRNFPFCYGGCTAHPSPTSLSALFVKLAKNHKFRLHEDANCTAQYVHCYKRIGSLKKLFNIVTIIIIITISGL